MELEIAHQERVAKSAPATVATVAVVGGEGGQQAPAPPPAPYPAMHRPAFHRVIRDLGLACKFDHTPRKMGPRALVEDLHLVGRRGDDAFEELFAFFAGALSGCVRTAMLRSSQEHAAGTALGGSLMANVRPLPDFIDFPNFVVALSKTWAAVYRAEDELGDLWDG